MPAKDSVEVRLIGKSAVDRYLTNSRASGAHQQTGPFDASIDEINMRRHFEADLKCPAKVILTEADELGHIGAMHHAAKPFLDEHFQTTDPPWCKASSADARLNGWIWNSHTQSLNEPSTSL
jgi:hypothetical protein